MIFDSKKQLTRCMKELQNTIRYGVTILPYYCTTHETTTFAGNVSAGKRIKAYISPPADDYDGWIDYFDTYTKILNLNTG